MNEWTPCNKKDCKFYVAAECEAKIQAKVPRKALWMYFGSNENIAVAGYGSGSSTVYPCLYCKHFEPTKFDLYTGGKNETI